MGWPLAVSAALMERNHRALPRALGMLALGHFMAMLAILLPFSMLMFLVHWDTEIRIAAGVLVVCMGIYLLINRKHPRFLSRVHPARLALWSFLAAMAHGAGLMLVPIFFGISGMDHDQTSQHAAHFPAINSLSTAFTVSAVHTLAMALAGGIIATVIYFWLGLKFLSRTWFNLDLVWAISLIIVGVFGIYSAHTAH